MEVDGNDSLSIEHKEEIHIFHKSMDMLISSILNNINFKIKSVAHSSQGNHTGELDCTGN